jgi:LacI family transcriptional regulator
MSKTTGRPKLADVAKHAGLSITTVSMVLNDRPNSRISEEARSRVLESALELNYRPNISAKTLKTSKNNMIGFISDEVATTRFASGLIRGALKASLSSNHAMLVMETGGDYALEVEAFNTLSDRQVDQIIFASMRAREIELPPVSQSTRIVMLNATNQLHPLSVLPDEFQGGRTAITALLENRRKPRIALIGKNRRVEESIFDSITIPLRVSGMKEQLKLLGASIEIEIETNSWDPEDGFEATEKLLKSRSDITALICMNDRLAFGAYQAISNSMKSIPSDIAIVSFDNDPLGSHLKPGLTTVALPHEEMGSKAVKLLLGESIRQSILVPMPLISRESA